MKSRVSRRVAQDIDPPQTGHFQQSPPAGQPGLTGGIRPDVLSAEQNVFSRRGIHPFDKRFQVS